MAATAGSYISVLPVELLEKIATSVAQVTKTTKERKNALDALKNSSPLFFRLKAVNKGLFERVHVFTTPFSIKRLEGISRDSKIRKLVERVTIHYAVLNDPTWMEGRGYKCVRPTEF